MPLRAAALEKMTHDKSIRMLTKLSLCHHPTPPPTPHMRHCRPHLLAASTNTAAVLLAFDVHERPSVVALPAQVVTLEALMTQQGAAAAAAASGDKAGGGGGEGAPGSKGAQGLTYVTAAGGRLWSSALRLEAQRAEGAAERSVRLQAAPPEAIATLDHPGGPVLACSPSGRSISVVWPQVGGGLMAGTTRGALGCRCCPCGSAAALLFDICRCCRLRLVVRGAALRLWP